MPVTQHSKARRLNASPPGTLFVEIKKYLSASNTTSRKEKRSEQDLNAQQEMADWTESMLWASMAALFLTLIGIYYVRNTLLETRRIGEAQARAYLSPVEEIEVVQPSLGEFFGAEIVVGNTGASPAYGVEGWYGIRVLKSAVGDKRRRILSENFALLGAGNSRNFRKKAKNLAPIDESLL